MPVRWAFTSPLVRGRMAGMRKKSDSVLKALEKLWHEKYCSVAIQPLQTIPGQEYNEVLRAAQTVANSFELDCEVGQPLMATGSDARRVACALAAHVPAERNIEEDVVFVGHGARHENFCLYIDLARALQNADSRLHLGTMSGDMGVDKILPSLCSEVVWIVPLLSIVGKHATNDIAGENGQSWKSRIEAAGHLCRPVLRGVTEYGAIAGIWLDNLSRAVDSLKKRSINY